jgi:hypothetical protein
VIEGGEGAKTMSPGWWFDRAEGVGVGVVVGWVFMAKAMSPGWWFDRAEGVGVGVVVSCVLRP